MGGIGGFAGVIPTLWCTLRGYARDQQRAVIQNFNLVMQTVTFALHVGNGKVELGHGAAAGAGRRGGAGAGAAGRAPVHRHQRGGFRRSCWACSPPRASRCWRPRLPVLWQRWLANRPTRAGRILSESGTSRHWLTCTYAL